MHTDTQLVRRAIQHAKPKPWADKQTRWAVVCKLFGIEEAEAFSICKRHDIDPEEKISAYEQP